MARTRERIDEATVHNYHVRFGIYDKQQREIGASITTYMVEYVDAPADAQAYWPDKPIGRYFAFQPHATRNLERYGASQHGQDFDTYDARDAAIIKYLTQAQKRARKQFPLAHGA